MSVGKSARRMAIACAIGFASLSVGALRAQSSPSDPPESSQIAVDGSNLFEILALAQGRIPMVADRTYLQASRETRANGSVESVLYRYRERIHFEPRSSGSRFALELLEVAGPGSASKLLLRRQAFAAHAGFLVNFRDFRVHDVALAKRNYRVVPMGRFLRLGRVALIFDVLPKTLNRSSYRFLVDAEHPIVLDQIEIDSSGVLISALFYEKLSLGTAARFPSSTKWWVPSIKVREHSSLAAASKLTGFWPRLPTVGLDGFELRGVRTARHPLEKRHYAILVYADGIDTRFVLEAKRQPSWGGGLSLSAPAVGSSKKAPPPVVPVMRYRLGPASQFHASRKGIDYLLVGNFVAAGIPTMLTGLLR